MLLVRSYRTFAPLPKAGPYFWRYVSVALASRLPALGVTQQSGLWEPGLSSNSCFETNLQRPRQLSFLFFSLTGIAHFLQSIYLVTRRLSWDLVVSTMTVSKSE